MNFNISKSNINSVSVNSVHIPKGTYITSLLGVYWVDEGRDGNPLPHPFFSILARVMEGDHQGRTIRCSLVYGVESKIEGHDSDESKTRKLIALMQHAGIKPKPSVSPRNVAEYINECIKDKKANPVRMELTPVEDDRYQGRYMLYNLGYVSKA